MEKAIYILLGALCAIVGSIAAKWYEIKTARKLKMEEIIGEKKVEAYQKLLPLLTYLQRLIIKDANGTTLKYVEDNIEWLDNNRIVLPTEVYESWFEITLVQNKFIKK